MNRSYRSAAVLAIVAVAGALAVAQPAKEAAKPAAPAAAQPAPEGMQLPPGMTMEDVQACIEAGTPGEMHEYLAQGVGTWSGKMKMWMAPGTDPMESECVSTITPIMDGRYFKCETTGEMPGMGVFLGSGLYAFDNVSKQFQSTWIDNMSTGIAIGVGERSSDGKTMTWNLTYHCPITKKPCVLRQIERHTGKDSMVMEMHGTDPKSGKEYKMMEIAYTRKAAAAAPTSSN